MWYFNKLERPLPPYPRLHNIWMAPYPCQETKDFGLSWSSTTTSPRVSNITAVGTYETLQSNNQNDLTMKRYMWWTRSQLFSSIALLCTVMHIILQRNRQHFADSFHQRPTQRKKSITEENAPKLQGWPNFKFHFQLNNIWWLLNSDWSSQKTSPKVIAGLSHLPEIFEFFLLSTLSLNSIFRI